MNLWTRIVISMTVSGLAAGFACSPEERSYSSGGGAGGDTDASAGASGGMGAMGGSGASGGIGAGGFGGIAVDGGPDASFVPCTDDADCDDGNLCNGAETCSGGVCAPGTFASNGSVCTVRIVKTPEVVVPDAGLLDAGGAMADASADASSNGGDAGTNEGGSSAPGVDAAPPQRVDAPGLCYDGDCLQECSSPAECDDENPCNGLESCDGGRGVCVPGVPPNCDDENLCTTDLCDVTKGDPSNNFCWNVLKDVDGDGHADEALGPCGDDCDDSDETVYTGAPELCTDGKDNDCNGETDESTPFWYVDCDEDGFAASNTGAVEACDAPGSPPAVCGGGGGWTLTPPAEAQDCDDVDPLEFPDNPEVCDGRDSDCSGVVDDKGVPKWADCDKDGTPASGAQKAWSCVYDAGGPTACPTGGWTTREPDAFWTDCDDNSNVRYPTRTEDCSATAPDGIDNNCDGLVDNYRWYADCDDDFYAASGAQTSTGCTEPASPASSCNGTGGWTRYKPAAEYEDCDDTKNLVYPRRSGYESTADDTWGFDYNCDGKVTRQYTETGVTEGACTPLPWGSCDGVVGWTAETAPECGETASYSQCLCSGNTACDPIIDPFCDPYYDPYYYGCSACSRETTELTQRCL